MKKRTLFTFCIAILLCLFSVVVSAATPAYQNDFSSGTINATEWKTWNLDPSSNGAWDIADVGGNKMLRGQISKFNDTLAHYKAKKFKDVTVEADIVLERGNAIGMILRMDDSAQGYQLIFDQFDGIKLCRRPYYAFKSGGTVDVGTKYHVLFSAIGDKIKAVITNSTTNETMSLEVTDTTYTGSGYIGFNVYGFDTNGTSPAVGLFDNIKVYDGAVEAITTSSTAITSTSSQSASKSSQAGTVVSQSSSTIDNSQSSDVSQSEEQSSQLEVPAFNLISKFSDVSVDNAKKIVSLGKELNISELKDSFTIPEGYSLKVVDAQSKEITTSQKIVTKDMKMEFTKDDSTKLLYTLTLKYNDKATGKATTGSYLWVIILIVIIVGGAGAGLFFYLRSKKKVI